MTVLDWLKRSTRYTFEEESFEKIALDRGCDPESDAYGEDVTQRQRELMTADLIFEAIMLSPSNTASLSQSHNGYQKTIGSETDVFQSKKLEYALGIYEKYDDEKALLIKKKNITFVPIVDVISV